MAILLKFLLVSFLVYYLGKEILKKFLPHLIQKYINKMTNQQMQDDEAKEGETKIKSAPKRNDQSLDNKGEYVDYEEID